MGLVEVLLLRLKKFVVLNVILWLCIEEALLNQRLLVLLLLVNHLFQLEELFIFKPSLPVLSVQKSLKLVVLVVDLTQRLAVGKLTPILLSLHLLLLLDQVELLLKELLLNLALLVFTTLLHSLVSLLISLTQVVN